MPNNRSGNCQREDKQFKESPWYIGNFMRDIDNFGQPLPTFNIKGKDKI